MSLVGAADGLYAALITGALSAAVFWFQNRSRSRGLADAWQKQAADLHQELKGQYEGRITYLQTQLDVSNQLTNQLLSRVLLAPAEGAGSDD